MVEVWRRGNRCFQGHPRTMSSLANLPMLHQAVVVENPPTSSASTSSSAQTRKRVRTGCLNCRRKHKKCDENKPVCHGCISKNEVCEWPVSKLKKTSRRNSTHYTTSPVATTTLLPQHLHHTPALQPHSAFPVHVFPRAPQIGMNYTPPPLPQSTVFPPAGSLSVANPHARKLSTDLFSYSLAQQQPQSDAHSGYSSTSTKDDLSRYSPRNYQLSTALPMMRSESAEIRSKQLTIDEQSQMSDLSKTLETYLITGSSTSMTASSPLFMRDEDQMSLMAHYLSRVAPSLDIDDEMFFSEQLPLRMRNEPSLLYSVLALSSLSYQNTITATPLMLFKHALMQFIATRRASDQPTKEQLIVRESTLLFLTLFLYHHSQHKHVVHHLNSSNPSITFHITLLRLTLSQFIIPEQAPSSTPAHKILPLLSMHQQDFLTSFNKATTCLSEQSTILEQDSPTSTFPQILLPPRSIHTHILLTTAIVRLLSHKPMDVQVRSHPVAYYAKRLCGIIKTNKDILPWYSHWCLFTAGKVFTHESEHKEVLNVMNAIGKSSWETKIRDYWEGRGDV